MYISSNREEVELICHSDLNLDSEIEITLKVSRSTKVDSEPLLVISHSLHSNTIMYIFASVVAAAVAVADGLVGQQTVVVVISI